MSKAGRAGGFRFRPEYHSEKVRAGMLSDAGGVCGFRFRPEYYSEKVRARMSSKARGVGGFRFRPEKQRKGCVHACRAKQAGSVGSGSHHCTKLRRCVHMHAHMR